MLRPKIHPALFPLLLGALLAACGSEAGKTSDLTVPEQFDACAVLTFEDAHAFAGVPVAGVSSMLDDAVGRSRLECTYNAGTIENPRLLSLLVRPATSARAAARRVESSRSFLRTRAQGDVKEVSGIGDKALWAGGSAQQLHVSKGAVQLIVTMQAGKDPLGAARKVAEKAFAAMETAPSPPA
jgi:hypothetical protein